MSLATTLATSNKNINNQDSRWVIFVRDHKDLIIKNSQTYECTDQDTVSYQYRFKALMVANKIDLGLLWVAEIINDIKKLDEVEVDRIYYIPTRTYIETLYRQYQTSTTEYV